uniref:DNA-directed RNA polymerase subunit beta n=1 Tax=Cyperus fuscus TaxID=529431 RepID=A0A6H0EWT9_9POAL|nr:RNA polymerase beta subunit [Cyperus glomeratus]QIB72696.1 RNA polymerase beta subunit [Cyperus difformis]QIT06788.1 RNA polymerase beta subunit [Cyperus fuscus]
MIRNGNERMSTIPGSRQIQFEGYCRFINKGMAEEFDKFPKAIMEDIDHNMEFQLSVERYQLVEPLIKDRDAVYQSLTYSSKLNVPAGLIRTTSRHMQELTVFIGNIPIMSSQGTFIINGTYRTVINQILQSPGIYYRSELDYKGISVYTGTIISDWGGRSKLEMDRKARIWARVSRKHTISILALLSAMGSNLREILDNACYPDIFLSFPNDKEPIHISSQDNAILELYNTFCSVEEADMVLSESLYKVLQNQFLQNQCELGRIRRRYMNRRLNLDIPENNMFLLPRDVLAAADHLIGMKLGMGTLDDMNHLNNKRIRSVGDLLQDQFRLALLRLENAVRNTICAIFHNKWIPTPQNLVTSTSLTIYESFFGLHPLSQVSDQTNPLAQVAHGRKWSYLGPRGLTSRTASFRIRDIHPSYYGRICPIDTSEGINAGLTGSLAIHARIGHWGSIESPFYKISDKPRKKVAQMVYLSPNRDEYYMVAAENFLALNQGIQEEEIVPARYRQEFLTIAWDQIHLRSIFPFHYFSIGASLIPFIEHNDANRALMSSNMQRQAVPLSRSEKCIVGTGLEGQTALDSGVSVIAEHQGKPFYTDTHKILLSSNGNIISIPLVKYQSSNKKTFIHQKPQVGGSKCIKKGQILADGAATVGGELALGNNILVAYMPWEGYNSEDAVLISERLIYEDIYTSLHIRRYEIKTYVTNQGAERITNEILHVETQCLRNLDRNGTVMLGSLVETGDILVGKLTPTEDESFPEDRLLRAILGMDLSTAKETSPQLPIGGRGRVIDVKWNEQVDSSDIIEMICVYILHNRNIKVGDTVAGRHGNNGIISDILSRQDMPYLHNGIPVDMVFNPLGVPSRMNVGQIFECSLGLAGDLLQRHYRIAPYDDRYEQEASSILVFSELYEASKQTTHPWVFEPEYSGTSNIYDGRTGDPSEQPVLIGQSYILILIHQDDDTIHGRSTGPYTHVTQQPLRGSANQCGQRVGEMEVSALDGFGVAHIVQEMLTYKSDHIRARKEVLDTMLIGGRAPNRDDDVPESSRVLVRELRSLALELNYYLVSEKNFQIHRNEE